MKNVETTLREYTHLFPEINKKREIKGYKILDVLSKTIPHLEDCIVADLGCSNGVITRIVSTKVKFIYGFDLDISNVEENKTFANNSSFVSCNIKQVPLSDHTVDIIICNHVYYWFENPTLLLLEIKRILKPNGYVYLSGPTRFSIYGEHRVMFAPLMSVKYRNYWLKIWGKSDLFELYYLYPSQILKLFKDFKLICIFPYFMGMRNDKFTLKWKLINLLSYISPTSVYLFKNK